jgi:hypothetical protein
MKSIANAHGENLSQVVYQPVEGTEYPFKKKTI